jgi:micrococcal nuclease
MVKRRWRTLRGEKQSVLHTALASFFATAVLATTSGAHSGGLDALGCHTNRKTGEYHCHRGPSATRLRDPSFRERTDSGGLSRYAHVARVIDGDTLALDDGERVRLIGVDTPETVHPSKNVQPFGKQATAFTRGLVLGKRVRLDYDPANAHDGHKDKYRRTLAYVFLPDGSLLNAEIIRQGYGFAYTRFPFQRLDEFRRYEREAWEESRGLWGPIRER